jgi:predicted transcriptional regulator
MIPKLNKELIQAVDGHDQIEAVNPETGRTYVLIERSVFELHQRRIVRDAIQQGLDDVKAGRTMTVEESKRRTDELLDQSRQ